MNRADSKEIEGVGFSGLNLIFKFPYLRFEYEIFS